MRESSDHKGLLGNKMVGVSALQTNPNNGFYFVVQEKSFRPSKIFFDCLLTCMVRLPGDYFEEAKIIIYKLDTHFIYLHAIFTD